ncbi:MAG TPA: FAD-dependent oxidoreductase [Solirubrobacteraceae bacterium]|nr:FAD-dependent oxidoreductase [Solirubrobacteraceae bacterium]
MPRPRVQAETFPDLNDETLFPPVSDAKLERLARMGERRSFSEGGVLFEQSVRDAPFFVIERGAVDLVDRRPDEDVWFSRQDRSFIGDIAIFTGEPTICACVAAEPTDVIAFDRTMLRHMAAKWPEFAQQVLWTMSARRTWLEDHGVGVLRLIAPRSSNRAFQVRDLLERNLLPVQWYDTDADAEGADLLDTLNIPRNEAPVLVRSDSVLRNPSPAQVARTLGLRADVDGETFDLVVLGAGPAGLAAGVYGASEGLRTFVAEQWAPGGQAGTSMRIENYLGFPTGITGTQLTRKATLQALRFDAVLSSFHGAVEIVDGPEGTVRVDLDDGQHVVARTVLVATGARWRSLHAENVERFTGAGVYSIVSANDARRYEGQDVIVVGGGNSAGQAAANLSRRARSVRVVIRRDSLAPTMSRYLLDRIERAPNVEIVPRTEVAAVHGNGTLEAVSLADADDGHTERVGAAAVFVMIGADPCTEAVGSMLAVDEAGFLLCGEGARDHHGDRGWPENGRDPFLLETVRPGVFAAGDVRSAATKRVAGAVGDGAMAVRFVHDLLDG